MGEKMVPTSDTITVTDRAAQKIQQHIARRGRGMGIKVGVRTTGCSGLAYVLEYVDVEQGREICMEHHDINGVRVYLDPKHRPYLYGMTIDYVRNGLNEGFDFINPNERDRCGCGESFRV
jgi:iron-sulfur cluster assembly protein